MTLIRHIWCVVVWFVLVGVVVPRLAADDTDSQLSSLIEDLEGPSGVAAGAAVVKLGELQVESKRVLTALLKALSDGRPAEELPPFVPAGFPRCVNDVASWTLAEIGEPAVDPLAQLASGSDPVLRQRAVQTLGRIGPNAARTLPQLSELLQHDQDAAVRSACLQAVAVIQPDPQKLALLVQRALDDRVPSIRIAAAETISQIGPNAVVAVPRLLALLGDTAAEVYSPVPDAPSITVTLAVRREAAKALGRIGPAARSALSALRRMAVIDPDIEMRLDAAVAVCRLDCDSQTEFNIIVSLAAGSDEFGWMESETVKDWQLPALRDLVELGRRDEAAFNRLGTLLSSNDYGPTYLFSTLVTAVAVVGGTDSIPLLMRLMNEVDENDRGDIVEALGHLGVAAVTSFIEILADSLDTADSNYFAVHQVCEELGRVGRPANDALPYLSHLVTRQYHGLSAQAARSIGQIGTDDLDVLRALEKAASSDDAELRDAATEALQLIRN